MPRHRRDGSLIIDRGGARLGAGRRRTRYTLAAETVRMLDDLTSLE